LYEDMVRDTTFCIRVNTKKDLSAFKNEVDRNIRILPGLIEKNKADAEAKVDILQVTGKRLGEIVESQKEKKLARFDLRIQGLEDESDRASSNRARALKEAKLSKTRLRRQLFEGVDDLKTLRVVKNLRPKLKYEVKLLQKKEAQARKDMAQLKKLVKDQESRLDTANTVAGDLKYSIGGFVEYHLTKKKAPVRIKVVAGESFTDIYITGGTIKKDGAKKQFRRACTLLEKWHVDYGIPKNPPNPEKYMALSVAGLPDDDGNFDSVKRFKMLSVGLVPYLKDVIRVQIGQGSEFSILGSPLKWRLQGQWNSMKVRALKDGEYLSKFDPTSFQVAVTVNPVVG